MTGGEIRREGRERGRRNEGMGIMKKTDYDKRAQISI